MAAINVDKDHDAKLAPAFRDEKKPGPHESDVQVRPAGPEAMAEAPEDWDTIDQAADESFPASDPPSNAPADTDTAPTRAALTEAAKTPTRKD